MINQITTQTWQTFSDFNRTGLDGLFVYPQQVWGGFIPSILLALFIIVLLATFFTQKRLTAREDFFSSFAVAGFFVAVMAIIMTLVEGLIDNYTLTITIVIAIVGVILLFITKDR